MPGSWCYINVFRFLFGSHTYLPALSPCLNPWGWVRAAAGKSACEPNKNQVELMEYHIPNRQSGTFYQLYLATAVYQRSILQQPSEHFVRRCILSANAGVCLADIKNWAKICPVVGITITLWGFRNEVRTNCQHQALVWVRKDELGRLLANKCANRIGTGTR